MAKPSEPSSNCLLASLSPADYDFLRPHLRSVELIQGAILFERGDLLERVYFPLNGVVSLIVTLEEGRLIEAAMIGRDSVLGGSSALDGQVLVNTAIVQIAGTGVTLDVARFRKLAEKSPAFLRALIRHEHLVFAQAQQFAACNAAHAIETRLSRWLLWARYLSGDDTLPLTQEFIAHMLGVQRSSLSLNANILQKAGLIRCIRGRVEITNLRGLKDASCECYGRVKARYDRLLNHPTRARGLA